MSVLMWAGLAGLGLLALGAAGLGGIEPGPVGVGGLELERIRVWQGLYLLGFAGYGAWLWGCARRGAHGRGWPASGAGVLIVAAALRMPLLLAAPNDDCNRYIWDGRIQLAGFNPFSIAPDDPRLAGMRDDLWAGINHPEWTTIYPPLAQGAFALMATVADSVKSAQVFAAACDVATVAVWLRLLAARGLPPWYAGVYAFCPLVLAAFALGGHIDSLMLLCVALYLLAMERRRWAPAGVALAGAVLAKTVPLILLPGLLRRRPDAGLLALALIAAGYAPYAGAGRGLIASLTAFPMSGRFCAALDTLTFDALPLEWRNALAVVLLGGLAVGAAWRPGDVVREARRLLGATVLLLPIVHHWYVAWPLLAATGGKPRGALPWIALAASMAAYWLAPLSAARGGAWALTGIERWVMWGPCVALFTAGAVIGWRASVGSGRAGGRPGGR